MDKPNAVTLFNGTFYEGNLSIEKGADFTHDSHYSKLATLNASKAIGDGRIEFVDAGIDMVRKAERAFRQGNLDETSLSNITVINLLQEVVRRQYRDYHAIEAMKRIPVPKLQLDVPISDKYTASKKVGEFVEPDQKTNKFTTAELRLFKNMVSIYESDESQLKATIEPLSYEIDQASGALAKAANEQIVAEIETATGSAKGDWGAMTTNADFSARNPLDDITDVVNTMQDLHFRPDTICMHPRVSSDYLSNTFINGYNNAVDRQGAGTYPLPKFPGLKVVSDLGFTSTVATVLDSNTMLLGEGPMVAEQFRNPLQSADGWVIRQWLHPLLVSADGSRKMTSVSA